MSAKTQRQTALLRGARLRLPCFLLEERQDLLDERVSSKPVLFAQDRNGAVLDELVGPTDADDGRVDHLRVQVLDHSGAETVVQDVVLERAQHLRAAREELERAGVERLDPAGV